jgi:hypothetical protein
VTEREFTVSTSDETTMAFREEWLSGEAGGKKFALDIGVGHPTVTVNVLHGDRWVRESVDLMPMLTEWVKAMHKDLKKEQVHHGDD